jgi:hypothetical protein
MAEETEKVYYRKSDGYLCERYPYNIPIDESSCGYLEMPVTEAERTYSCFPNMTWRYLNNELSIVNYVQSAEDAATEKAAKIAALQAELAALQ